MREEHCMCKSIFKALAISNAISTTLNIATIEKQRPPLKTIDWHWKPLDSIEKHWTTSKRIENHWSAWNLIDLRLDLLNTIEIHWKPLKIMYFLKIWSSPKVVLSFSTKLNLTKLNKTKLNKLTGAQIFFLGISIIWYKIIKK